MYWVYILTNERNTTLYIGVTNDLSNRLDQHRKNEGSNFVRRYNLNKLVHLESSERPFEAIKREKQLQAWSRIRKNALIDRNNPGWRDLSTSYD